MCDGQGLAFMHERCLSTKFCFWCAKMMAFSGVSPGVWGGARQKVSQVGPFLSFWVGRLIEPENLRLIARLTVCFHRS